MSRPVTLVAWEDADKSPPETIGPKLTDQGLGYRRRATCHWHRESDGEPMDPQPSVWCDPIPPGPDALTVEDLRNIHDICMWHVADLQRRGIHYAESAVEADDLAARLRAALDALENGGAE